MSNDYLTRLKASFVETHRPYLCEESIRMIEKARTLAQFIDILHHFVHFKFFDQVPSLEWAHEWFDEYLQEANACGVYLDQITTLDNPKQESIILLGKCHVNAILVRPATFYITLRDESHLSLITYGTANATVRLKGEQTTFTNMHHSPYSRIKTHKI